LNRNMIGLLRCMGMVAVAFLMVATTAFCETHTLNDLYRIALERSERIRLSEQNLLLAEAGKDKKRAALLPRLSAYGGYTAFSESKKTAETPLLPGVTLPGSIVQPDYSGQWGLRLDQAMTLNGREIKDFNISRNNIRKQEQDVFAQKEDYLLVVSISYFEVLQAKKALDIADAALERLTLYRAAAEKRLKVGEITKTVLLRADGERSGALAEQIKARNALTLSRVVLARIVGIGEDFQLVESPAGEETLLPLDAYIETAMAHRADLKSAEIEKHMTENQIDVARGGFWPTLSIAGVYGRYDQYPVAATTNRESAYGQVALNFPFFEGGLRMAEVREASVRNRQAQLRLDDLKKTIRVEVETTYVELKNLRGILLSLRDQLAFASDNYKAVSRQFEFGLANSIDVMDANTLLVSTERQLSAAVYAYGAEHLRMKRATGLLLREVLNSGK